LNTKRGGCTTAAWLARLPYSLHFAVSYKISCVLLFESLSENQMSIPIKLYVNFILPNINLPTLRNTKKQRSAMRAMQRMGTRIARRAVIIDPTSSKVDIKGFPAPPVKTEDFARNATVVPCTIANDLN
jgi:hypothetical protein